MKLVLVASLVLAACGAPQPPARESALVREGSDTPESCCCKSTPITSDDGKPVYEMMGRMECSSKQGDCVLDVQCPKAAPTPPSN